MAAVCRKMTVEHLSWQPNFYNLTRGLDIGKQRNMSPILEE